MYNYCAITIGFFNVIRYHQVTKRLAFISGVTYMQHRLTDKVERSGTFVQRIFRPRTCGFLPQHLFHSSSPASPGFFLREDFAPQRTPLPTASDTWNGLDLQNQIEKH
jgi:hypothetical protein